MAKLGYLLLSKIDIKLLPCRKKGAVEGQCFYHLCRWVPSVEFNFNFLIALYTLTLLNLLSSADLYGSFPNQYFNKIAYRSTEIWMAQEKNIFNYRWKVQILKQEKMLHRFTISFFVINFSITQCFLSDSALQNSFISFECKFKTLNLHFNLNCFS